MSKQRTETSRKMLAGRFNHSNDNLRIMSFPKKRQNKQDDAWKIDVLKLFPE